MISFEGRVVFWANDSGGPAVWISDGTSVGTGSTQRSVSPRCILAVAFPFFAFQGRCLLSCGRRDQW